MGSHAGEIRRAWELVLELENNHKIVKIDSRILYVIFLFV